MRPATTILLAAVAALSADRAEAEEPRRIELGASLGYGLPLGSAEGGAPLSDVSFGFASLNVEATYLLTRAVGLVVTGEYGAIVPTLCQTAADCLGSTGSDVVAAVHVRFLLPHLGPVSPFTDMGIGYEWFASRLDDAGVTSTRSFRGPLLSSAELGAPIRLSSRWTFGPALHASIGTFTDFTLQTPGHTEEGAVTDRSLHAWLALAARLSARF